MAGKAVVIIIGAMLLLAGVGQIVSGLRQEHFSGKLPPLILGFISALCGVGLFAEPWVGMAFIALILAISFVVEGIYKIVASFSYRPASGWLLLLFSGVVSLVLGLLIWRQWPLSGIYAVGILVGVNLLFTGISLLAVSSTIRALIRMTQSEPAETETA